MQICYRETVILLIYVTCVHSLETGKWHEVNECLPATKTNHFITPMHLLSVQDDCEIADHDKFPYKTLKVFKC